jgi:hypothetical protein
VTVKGLAHLAVHIRPQTLGDLSRKKPFKSLLHCSNRIAGNSRKNCGENFFGKKFSPHLSNFEHFQNFITGWSRKPPCNQKVLQKT